MDKSSIFNLITSLLEFYTKKNGQKTQPDESQSKPTLGTNNLNQTFNLNNLLSSLNLLPKPTPQASNEIKKEQKQETKMPLNVQMLSTIDSHDKFIRRVMKNNKK